MKNVMIVGRQGKAIAYGEGVKICKTSTGVFLPSLEVLKEVLESIPSEVSETVHIHLMDTVQGIQTGSAVEYVKTGKTGTGNSLTAEEIAMFKDIYKLYAEKILNVRFSLIKYIRKTDTDNLKLKQDAYTELERYEKSTGTAVTVDPDKELRDMFDAQIKEAMLNKDMATVKDLMALRGNLKEPTVMSSTSQSRVRPSFENGEASDNVDNNETQTDDDPINFESAEGAQPSF